MLRLPLKPKRGGKENEMKENEEGQDRAEMAVEQVKMKVAQHLNETLASPSHEEVES